jgi:hypothetical protein
MALLCWKPNKPPGGDDARHGSRVREVTMNTAWTARATAAVGATGWSLGPAFAAPLLCSCLVAQVTAAKEINQKYSQYFGI